MRNVHDFQLGLGYLAALVVACLSLSASSVPLVAVLHLAPAPLQEPAFPAPLPESSLTAVRPEPQPFTHAVVQLVAEGPTIGTGTAFLVGRDRDNASLFLTAAHVVHPDCDEFWITTTPGSLGDRYLGVRPRAIDRRRDLALVATPGEFRPFRPLAIAEPGRLSYPFPVRTAGYPDNRFFSRDTHIVGSRSFPGSLFGAPPTWKLNDQVYPGQSGSPVVADDGSVVGVILSRGYQCGYCSTAGQIHEFFQENGYAWMLYEHH